MIIEFAPHVMALAEAITAGVGGQEWSGFGFATKAEAGLHVYDLVPLNVGNPAYTEIDHSQVMEIAMREDAKNLRVWIHRHPVGNGIPGRHNWSGTDERTIQLEPLGSVPELVKWSASCVRTPRGWVGRIDNHLTKKTVHVEVTPALPNLLINKVWNTLPRYAEPVVQYRPVPRPAQKPTLWADLKSRFGSFSFDKPGQKTLWDEEVCDVCCNDFPAHEITTCSRCDQMMCEKCRDLIARKVEGEWVCEDCRVEFEGVPCYFCDEPLGEEVYECADCGVLVCPDCKDLVTELTDGSYLCADCIVYEERY